MALIMKKYLFGLITIIIMPGAMMPSVGYSYANTDKVLAVNSHSLAITNDGVLWGWGNNYYWELGDGETEGNLLPINREHVPIICNDYISHTINQSSITYRKT